MSEEKKPVGVIFDAAIELPPEQRQVYVRKACAGDEALRQRLEALLRAHEAAESFMEKPAAVSRLTVKLELPAPTMCSEYAIVFDEPSVTLAIV